MVSMFSWTILSLLFLLGGMSSLNATELSPCGHGLGLIPPTAEQLQEITQTKPRIIGVRMNKIGAHRVKEHLKKQGRSLPELPAASFPEEEFVSVIGPTGFATAEYYGISPNDLPRSVDNTTLPSFPPIGNQGAQGSCVAWGTTYYHATHEYGLLNGINNKNSATHICSPKWTYDNLNGGNDQGLQLSDAYEMLAINGVTSWENFPYDQSDYRAWDLNPDHWVSAISYRMGDAKYTDVGDPTNLPVIKQILANGHNLTMATFVLSFVQGRVGDDGSGNPHIGEAAVRYMSGQSGPHCMSIVGYDDDIWIDVNGNGQVEDGEKGAFLIANSWGSSYGNSGTIWVSYDAYLANSRVMNNGMRQPVASAMNNLLVSVVPKAANYSPKVVAQFTLTQGQRNQFGLAGGASSVDETSPVQKFRTKALYYQGGPYGFDGGYASSQTATFALDMTDLLPATSTSQRYYLSMGDSTNGTMSTYTLLDKVHGNKVECTQMPMNCNSSVIRPYIDYTFTNVDPNKPPVVSVTSPVNGEVLNGTAQVTANATSDAGISHVDFYVDSTLYSTDLTTPYMASVDTTKLSEGTHQLYAIAYDISNNKTQSTTVSVQVKNGSKDSLYINAGGDAVSYLGASWEKDRGFTTPSYAFSTSAPFANPVYETERYGTFSYNFPIANGSHTVKLKFAETYLQTAGERVFDVVINGKKVISNLDLYKVAGFNKPYDRNFTVNVTDGKMKIDFIPTVGSAKVNGIIVTTP